MTQWKNRSLRFRLTIIVSLTALLIWLISTTVAWIQVRKELNKMFDAQQILFAQRLATSGLHTILAERRPPKELRREFRLEMKRELLPRRRHNIDFDDDALAFAVFNTHGERVLHDGRHGEFFPFQPQTDQFSHHYLNNGDDEPWRIFWLSTAGGQLLIAVGQELDYRDDLSEEMVFGQMWIWFASLPLLIGLIVWIISRELKTLRQVGEAVAKRRPEEREALSTNVPKEIRPLVHSLNQFFERTATQLLRERRFTSDAAHELRSPLAGLKIQTELAQIAGNDHAMREKALDNLTLGINRATQLIEQLLTLSRLDNLRELEGVAPIDWEKLIGSLIGELYFQAQAHHIDLQFDAVSIPPNQQGQPLLLSMMLRNLIENAIKYTPDGTVVRISLYHTHIVVADNGGGVSDSDLSKLGQRFYRPAGQNEKGSGLGLSIVQRIAELHHFRFHITNQMLDGKIGLSATLTF